ncbi:hypothetical protein AAY473_038124 [Plecturocebus cupreus]
MRFHRASQAGQMKVTLRRGFLGEPVYLEASPEPTALQMPRRMQKALEPSQTTPSLETDVSSASKRNGVASLGPWIRPYHYIFSDKIAILRQ